MADALMWLVLVLAVLGFSWATVVVHEYSHVLFGLLVGVPWGRMRVQLAVSPPQVQLRNGEKWIEPDGAEYIEAFRSIRPSLAAAWTFTAGGMLGETFLVATSSTVLILVSAEGAAAIWVATSTILLGLYLIGDVLLSVRRGRAYGDYSGMWAICRMATVAAVAGCFAVRFAILAWAL